MSVVNSLNNASTIIPATGSQTVTIVNPNANIMHITPVMPGTVPHFDCSNEVERDITDILIYHDILIGVSKPEPEKASVNSGGQNLIFINLNVPKGTTWAIKIDSKVYKISLSDKTLRFHKPDGVSYKIIYNDISKLLLALIHSEMDFCDKCAIPKQEFMVIQESEPTQTVYDWGHNWMPTKQITTGLELHTTGTTLEPTDLTTLTTFCDYDHDGGNKK